jgi:hypothetical protein
MRKILCVLLIGLSIGSYAANTINFYIWSISVDTATNGQTVNFTAKFNNPSGWQSTDSLRISATGPNYTFPYVFKMKASDALALPTNPDGTTSFSFMVPNNSNLGKWMKLYPQSATHMPLDSIYIISSTPDITYKGSSSYNDTTGQTFHFTIDYTFLPTNQDTLRAYLGDSLIYKGLYVNIINAHVPYFNSSGNYKLTIEKWNGYDLISVTKPNHTVVNGIIDPINNPTNIVIHYYNIEGLEIEKPSKGLFIWKTETGESGKLYIIN